MFLTCLKIAVLVAMATGLALASSSTTRRSGPSNNPKLSHLPPPTMSIQHPPLLHSPPEEEITEHHYGGHHGGHEGHEEVDKTYTNYIQTGRGHDPWHGYYDGGYGGGELAYGKSEYWLIPLVIVIGFGALLLPLLGTFMTTMLTSGTLTLQAGRRKRSVSEENAIFGKPNMVSESILSLLTKVEKALDTYGKNASYPVKQE